MERLAVRVLTGKTGVDDVQGAQHEQELRDLADGKPAPKKDDQ